MLALKFCIGKFSGVWHLQAWNQQPLPHGDHRPHQRIKQLRTRERKDAGVTAKFRFSDCPSCSPVGILALRRESGSFSPVPWLHVILASNSVSSSPHRCQWWGKGRHSGQRGDTLLGLLGREKDRHVSWATLLSRIFSCAKWIQYGSIQRRDCLRTTRSQPCIIHTALAVHLSMSPLCLQIKTQNPKLGSVSRRVWPHCPFWPPTIIPHWRMAILCYG